MDNKKKVTKKEFYDFINQYPGELVVDVTGIFERPLKTLKTWNDFKKAPKWPDSVVAFCKLYDGSEYHEFKNPEYFIYE